MSELIDIAVELGAVAPSLPEIECFDDLMANAQLPPPQVIGGIVHRGCKLVLGGTSKSYKSWCLLDMALSVASGQPWWGHRCEKSAVAYLNFELHDWALAQRVNAVRAARPECQGIDETLCLWNLRGHNADMTLLRPRLEKELSKQEFGLIILDPAYKLLGNRDENANGEIASLFNEFEALAQSSGAAVVVAHHFAKGDSSGKAAIDRMSGAGAWARDPDSLVILTPHEEEGCFTVNLTLRNLPPVEEFVVAWDYPLMRVAPELNPEALRRPQSKNKLCSDKEFVEAVLGDEGRSYKALVSRAKECFGMSEATMNRYLSRQKAAGLVRQAAGLYWAEKHQVGAEEGGHSHTLTSL